MIHDGVELPRLLPVARAAEVLGVDVGTVRQWIEDRAVSTLRVNGTVHVLTESIADRLGGETPTRQNRESL
jgi:predicted site-specific integrase-resolvase